MQFSATAFAALMGLAAAQNVHVVSVGSTNGSNIFSPNSLTAATGDMIQFQFRAGNHSVVQSNFDNPCMPISESTGATGMFSGFMNVAASEAMGMVPTYTMEVTNTSTMWFYCSQAKHCQSGMVMVVNEDPAKNASRTLSNFKTLAAAATANLSPGGTTSDGTSSGSSGSGSSTGSGSTASGSTTPAAGAGSVLSVSASMGLLSLAAAYLML
ncbi:Cupredoxin [Xylariaceae sp. FL0016]|nr:Cupredoxin [Xylariaceae sp. FL0016]